MPESGYVHWRVCASAASLCVKGRELEGGGAIVGVCGLPRAVGKYLLLFFVVEKDWSGSVELEGVVCKKATRFCGAKGTGRMAGRTLEISHRHTASDF